MCATRLQTESRHDRYLSQIKTILASVFKSQECTIYLFGSRARGTSATVSDFDIAVLAAEDISGELSLAREMLDLSNIPFTVDLVDLHAAGAALSRQAQAEGILIWKNRLANIQAQAEPKCQLKRAIQTSEVFRRDFTSKPTR